MEDREPLNRGSSRVARSEFPARSNPGRSTRSRGGKPEAPSPGDRGYPESCNPDRSRPPLTKEQQDLVVQYLPLAKGLAYRRRLLRRASSDDFDSTACLALVEAAHAFDPSRNVNFATYARYRIEGSLRDLQRDLLSPGWRNHRQPGPMVVALGKDAETHGRVIGQEPEDPIGASFEAVEAVENWIKVLPKSHAQAFRHIYIDGKSQEEAAELVGCSKSNLSRMHRDAIAWLHHNQGIAEIIDNSLV